MTKELILTLLFSYFALLLFISYLTSRKADNETFYTGNRNNPWYVVAFGMIGASLSGVTFISIPGTIGASEFTYLQIALGYILGYAIIAFVLLPLYYKLNLTSIYSYLETRFGVMTYKMGAGFFIVSRVIGASLRMYLVTLVLQKFVFDEMGVPFEVTVALSILLIWVYTFKGGIKTIIWTDTLQTLFMLISVGLSIYFIADDLNLALGEIFPSIEKHGLSKMWQIEDGNASNYWLKGILGGMFVTLGMTGVDQDMMQKNLTCRNLGEAKKNMLSFSVVLFLVNVLFVVLGALLFMYIEYHPEVGETWKSLSDNPAAPKGDILFATIALKSKIGVAVGVFFMLGLIAAAYSSADSALTSLSTSLSVDFLNVNKMEDKKRAEKVRKRAHIIMSFVLLVVIIIFNSVVEDNVIWVLFKAANYTYGPLLGLFMFGIISKRKVKDFITIPISVLVPVLMYFISENIGTWTSTGPNDPGFAFGYELLGINAALVYIFLMIFFQKEKRQK